MLKKLLTLILFINLISSFAQTTEPERMKIVGEIRDIEQKPVSYAHVLVKNRNEGWVGDFFGKFRIEVYPGDTLIISAISFQHAVILIPDDIIDKEYYIGVTMKGDTVNLKEVLVRPWPATYEQLRKEFMKVEIEDPVADLDLHLPSAREMNNYAYPEGGIHVSGPISMLYEQFSKEARSKKIYAELMNKEKAGKRYNKTLVSNITGLKDEDEIQKFMDYCALKVRFILESTDYELYAAIMNCYDQYCNLNRDLPVRGE